jgi:O-antigen/teichoic acid export membrane protein
LNPIKKLLGQTAVYGLSSILGRTMNFLLVPLYTTYFGPSEYGVISQLYALVAFLMVFLTFGMETSYFRFLQSKEDKALVFRNSFVTVLVLNAAFFLVVLFCNQGLSRLLLLPDNNGYISLMVAIVCVDAVSSIPLARLRAEEKAKQFALIQFSSIAVNIALNLLFVLFFFNEEHPEDGILFILVANLLSSLVKPVFLYKDFLAIKLKFHWKLFTEMFRYALPIVIAGFAFIINETIDRIMLKQMLYDPDHGVTSEMADTQIGIYSACYKLAMLISILLQAYRYAAEPFFFNQSKNQDRNRVYIRLMNYFVAAMCLCFLGVALNIDIFKYFVGKDYWTGLPVVPILLMANVFLGIYLNQSIWYKLSDQTKFGAYIAFGGALLTILINYLFIPVAGYTASAWATLIVYGAQMVASYLLGQKYYPIRYNLRKFFLYLGVSLVLFFIANALPLRDGSIAKFVVNNVLILVFVGLVAFIEGIKLKRT